MAAKYTITKLEDLQKMPEEEQVRRGELAIELLGLKMKDGWVRTSGGTKTALGLYRTLTRLVIDGE